MTFSGFLVAASCSIVSTLVLYIVIHRRLQSSQYLEKMLQVVQNEVSDLVTEINGVSDRNITIIDDRMKQIRILLEKSETIIAVFQRKQEDLKDLLRSVEAEGHKGVLQEEKIALPIKPEHSDTKFPEAPEKASETSGVSEDIASIALPDIVRLHTEQEMSTADIAKKLSISETEVETALLFYMYKLRKGNQSKDLWVSQD